MLKHILQNKTFNTLALIWLATLAHILNGYDISLNTKNYSLCNIQYVRYGLQTSIMDCCGQLVSQA